jgi:hypothetical protein
VIGEAPRAGEAVFACAESHNNPRTKRSPTGLTLSHSLDPYRLGVASIRTVWWRCLECGHEWQATVGNRSRGTGCPSCWRNRRAR